MVKKISVRNRWLYYITQLNHSLIFTIPIWIAYHQARINVWQISSIVTLQYLCQIVLELPSGALADLIGRRNTCLVGFIFGALGYLLLPRAAMFGHFLVLALMVGLSDSFRSGSKEALLYDSFKQDQNEDGFKKAYADGNMIYQVGLIIATALGGFIFELDQGLPFILYGCSLLIGAFFVSLYREPDIDSEKFTLKNYLKQIGVGSKEAFKSQYSKYLSLYYIFVGGIAWSSTLYFNGYLMIDLGFTDSVRGYLLAAMRALNVIVIGAVLKNDKLFNWKRTILFFPIVMVFAYLPGRFLNGVAGLPFVQAAMIATTARWIILSPLTNETFSSKYRATALSLLSLLIGIVYVTMTSLSGLVISRFGIKTMYSLLGIFTLLTVVPVTRKLLSIKETL